MGFFHFVSCLALTFGPHVVVYHGRELGTWRSWGTMLIGSGGFLVAQLVRLLLLGLLMVTPASATPGHLDTVLEAIRMLLTVADVAVLRLAVDKLASNAASQRSRALALGLGFALAESLCLRLPRLWVGARGMDWSWEFLALSVESGLALAVAVAAARLVSPKQQQCRRINYVAAFLVLAIPALTDNICKAVFATSDTAIAFSLLARIVVAVVALLAANQLVPAKDD